MKETVYISAYLSHESYGKSVASELNEKLRSAGYQVVEITNHMQNVWCRDYMPVLNPDNKLVQFKYAPSYMTNSEKWRKRIPKQKEIHEELNLDCEDTIGIILDGGAIELHKKQAIISDRVFRDNPGNETELIKRIKDYLAIERILVIPQYPYDFTGHIDGMARFIDDKRVLISDLSEEMALLEKNEKEKKNLYRCKIVRNWYYSFLMTFYNADLKTEVLPSNYANNKSYKHGNGIYMNFLKLSDLIVMPSYNNKSFDDTVKGKLKELYRREVITIDASKLAREGGMINCVTWVDQYVE